jgi:anti-sigma regulatory factor (Ser/Thr protein kinase)
VPSFSGFEFAARALPARHVSGDLYDFVPLDQETQLIVLADIAGKGVPAALLTSTARALLHAEADHDDSPAAILSSINASLCKDLSHAQMFITFLVARLDTRSGILTYANAGHNEILWTRHIEQSCHPLQATGVPIGIFENIDITEETIALLPGDALIFYSDGITEAENIHEEFFGLKRLVDLVSIYTDLSAEELCHIVVEAVETFRAGAPRSDDLTLVVLKALPRTIPFSSPAILEHLHDVTALIRRAASAYGDDFAYQVELATSEIVTNIIQHAYPHTPGELRGQITLFHDRVELDLYDDGMPFNPSALPAPELGKLQEGGYGLFIAKEMVSELTYTPTSPDGNHWRLIKLARKET